MFVYGTLTDPDRVARVVSEFEFRGEATLEGLRRVEAEYPTLAPGGEVAGRILRTSEVAALDAYEGVERGLYVRASVPLADEAGEVAVYVGDPDALGADVEWPDESDEEGEKFGGGDKEGEASSEGDGERSFAEKVERFVRESGVVVRPCE